MRMNRGHTLLAGEVPHPQRLILRAAHQPPLHRGQTPRGCIHPRQGYHTLAQRHIPYLDGLVSGGSGQATISKHDHAGDGVIVTREALQALPCGRVPHLDGIVTRAARHAPIRQARHASNQPLVEFQDVETLGRSGIPDTNGLITRTTCEVACGEGAQTPHLLRVTVQGRH